jgi:hypothetical protein
MKKILVFLVCIFPFLVFAERIEFYEYQNTQLFSHETKAASSTDIHFALDGFELESVTESGQDYDKIIYKNEGEFFEVGKPSLPQFTRLYAIEDQGEVSIEFSIQDQEIISNITVFPSQELPTESKIEEFPFTIDESYYQNGEIFPQQIVQVGQPVILRDLRIVSVTVNPFRYDPQRHELIIVKNVDIRLTTTGTGGINCRNSNQKMSKAFEPLYRSMVQNYDDLSRDDTFQQPCYLVIYANETSIPNILEPFLDWKHEKGFEVHAVSIGEIGNNFVLVKNYIQNAYNTWENRPEFICLVGDAEVSNFNIPTDYMDGGEGDQGFVRLDGTDILADAFIGRLSINSETHLQTILYKIFHYEREPFMNVTDWYNKALLVGDPSGSGPSTIDTKRSVKDAINFTHPNIDCTEVYNGSWVSQISSNINSGVSYFNYRGFGGMSGWTTSDIDQLANGFMLPVCVAITCQTGDFAGSYDCRSERFLKTGNPGNPKGGIAGISTATGMTHTCFNNCIDAGIYYGIFIDEIYNMGGALARGKLTLYQNFPNNPSNHLYQFSYWNNLMGDPGMEIWTNEPAEMLANFDDQINLGAQYMSVQVTDALGTPLQDAWVTALQGDDLIFATGYTDENGEIILDIDAEILGTAKLTVTKHDYIPVLETFEVIQNNSYVHIESIVIDDDNNGTSNGNNNQVVNPGETIELQVELTNSGTSTANNVEALLTSDSEWITIIDDSESYGNITAGSNVFSADDFDFQVDPACLGGTEIRLDLTITDSNGELWLDYIYVVVEGAYLHASDYAILNDPNGILEPGETANMAVTVDNTGFIIAECLMAYLYTDNEYINIEDDTGFYDQITAGGQAVNSTDQFSVTVDTQMIIGSQVGFYLQLTNADGFDQTVQFTVTIGEISVTDPVGPDSYGYYIFDDGDIGYLEAPQYNWIEINSIGTELQLYDAGDEGAIEDIVLPISFRFFGEDYQELTVCSNGWVTPGGTLSKSFMNWSIPGPLGPSPIIAAFWDDLRIAGNSGVFWYHDPVEHYVVIEWDHLQNDYNNAEETFQMILYDDNFYSTTLGDSKIKLQYQVVNNVNQGTYGYSVEHGAYCTVGIEDTSGQVGLEYTFNNTYPTAAKTLQNQMALLITGPPIDYEEPYILLNNIVIDDPNNNGLIEYTEEIDFDIILSNIGENEATNVVATLTINDDFVTLTQNTSSYNSIPGSALGTNITPFHLVVSEDCPDEHILDIAINVICDQDSWELQLSQLIFAPVLTLYSIFVDDGDNNVLDPGETADIHVSFQNQGGAAAYNVLAEISTADPYLTFNSTTSFVGDMAAGNFNTAMYNVSAAANAPIGHLCQINWFLDADYDYFVSGSAQIVISQIPVSITEEFNTFPPEGWSVTSTGTSVNWSGSNTNNAGGTTPEAMFDWSPSTVGIQRLQTDPINTIGSTSLDLQFNHRISNFSGDYELRLETSSNGTDWNTVQTWPPTNLGPLTENIEITSPDVGSETFQMAFTFDGNSYNINRWYMDDVSLQSSISQLMGYIEGHVTLLSGPGDVEEVVITAGTNTASPVTNGDFFMTLLPGTYDVSAGLDGYLTVLIEDVDILPLLTVELDFDLEFLTMPENLEATSSTNDVTLTWQMSSSREGSVIGKQYNQNNETINLVERENTNRNRTLDGFNIYRDEQMIHYQNDPNIMSYLDEFVNSEVHEYYVTAVYDETEESLPSNIAEVTITLEPPQNLTAESTGNDIFLDWDAPAFTRSLTGYDVFRNGESIAHNIDPTEYLDENMSSGYYYYYVVASYGGVLSGLSNIVEIQHTEVHQEVIPAVTELFGNSPNPFNPETVISFSLHEDQHTIIKIYNMKGELVKKLVNRNLKAGYHQILWNGQDENGKAVASGLYFCKFGTENYNKIDKMLLLK